MEALLMPLQALDDRLINPKTATSRGMFGIARYDLLLLIAIVIDWSLGVAPPSRHQFYQCRCTNQSASAFGISCCALPVT
jgi:hypothetical protein